MPLFDLSLIHNCVATIDIQNVRYIFPVPSAALNLHQKSEIKQIKKYTIMKKMKIMVYALIGLMTKSMACKANDKMVFAENLPTDAKVFVQHTFPRLSVAYAEMRTTRQGTVYEVSLNDGTEVFFSQNGTWGMIDCKSEAVPASLMPASLSSLVKSQFTDAKVVRLDRTESGYLAALSNGISLRFDHEGLIA